MTVPAWLHQPLAHGGFFTGLVIALDELTGDFVQVEIQPAGILAYAPAALFAPRQTATLYDFHVRQSSDGTMWLTHQACSAWFVHEPTTLHTYRYMKEICAGMGGIGIGAALAGITPIAHLEINPYSCQALIKNGASNVIQGDVHKPADVAKLHGAGPLRRAIISAGFPCQPYSAQGDKKGDRDPRSWTFLATLRAAWLMQAPALLLECVPAVQGHPFIRENLNVFADLMGFQIKTLTLALQDQWPCRRDRWWALLAPREFDLTQLVPWVKDEHYSTIGHIIPEWPIWERQDEEALQLSEEELRYYDDPSFGAETRLLQQTGICPTLLHSYGNVFQRCPCGCRQAAFHPGRLQRGGVRGCYIHSSVTGKPRFLHTAEASFLCTVPVQYQFPGDARDGLCLVGQIAAPLQAQWMCLHLVRAVQLHYDWVPLCIPQDHIKKTKLDLLWQRHHLWTTESSHATRHVWIKDQWGNNLHILREGQQDVADLLRAEARLADPHAHYQLWDGSRQVPHDAVLQDQGQHGPYTLIVNSPTTAPNDDREVEIIFYTNTTVTSATLPLGTYLFQACAAGHISPADTPPVDLQGYAIPLDTRLWSNTTVICRQSFVGGGDSDDGLNDQQIHSQLERLAHLHGELGGDHFQCPSPLLVPHPLPANQALGPAAALQLQHLSPTTPTTIIFAYNGHWALLTTTPTTDGFSATLYDGMPDPSLEGGHFLARWQFPRHFHLPPARRPLLRHHRTCTSWLHS